MAVTKKTSDNGGSSPWIKALIIAGCALGGYAVVSALTQPRLALPLKRGGAVQAAQSSTTFANVGGHDELKQQINRRIIQPFQQPDLYRRFGKSAGGGLLMWGPPGCGKTLLARATAGECKAKFFNVAISDVMDMYLGESERKLAEIFANARAAAPSVLFFDELEGLAPTRSNRAGSSIVSAFLTEMDGFSRSNEGVLVLGATNIPWAIDPAFRRPGRFDRMLFVPPPDRAARHAILQVLLSDRPRADDLDLDWIVNRTSGYSGADLQLLVEEAASSAIEASLQASADVPINNDHLQHATSGIKSTTREWFETARDQAKYENANDQYAELLTYLEAHGAEI